jgi:hypothetical protein
MKMSLRAKIGLMSGLALGALAIAAAGLYGNGLPQVGPQSWNSVAQVAPNGLYTQLAPGQSFVAPVPSNCCGPVIGVDTNQTGGAAPQTVGATPFQVAGVLLDALNNTQTSTVHAATSNTLGGVIITESLSTAAGSSYTFTLTNSAITAAYIAAGYVPQVAIYSSTNTGGRANLSGSVTSASTGNQSAFSALANTAQMTLTSETPAVGSVVWVWRNDGTTALNGTMYIAWHL